jgi:hypothetical protein
MKRLAFILISFLIVSVTYADSPLTSTNFYYAYEDVLLVKQAKEAKGKLSKEMLTYLAEDGNKLDVKLAIINAVGWNVNGLSNSKKFLTYVMNKKKYKVEFVGPETTFKWNATADELICYAYLKALDNYFNVVEASNVAGLALKKKPSSFSVNMIHSLIKSQGLTSLSENCYASKIFNTLKNNPNLTMDMRKESTSFIFEYMDFVGTNCD